MQENLFFLAIALGLHYLCSKKKLFILRRGHVPRQKPFHNLI